VSVPSSELGHSPLPASECVSPLGPKGGRSNSLYRRCGGDTIRTTGKKAWHCLLCGKYCKLFIFPYQKVNEIVRVPGHKQLYVEEFRRGKWKRGEIGGINIGKMEYGRLGNGS
jgi:hypothetical protein